MENFLVLNGHGSRLSDLETFNINTIPENNNIYIFFTKRNSILQNDISNIILAILSYNEDNITTELNILCDEIKQLDMITTDFRRTRIQPLEQTLFKLSYDIFIAINMNSIGVDIPHKLNKPRYLNWIIDHEVFERFIDMKSGNQISFEKYLLEHNLEMRFYTKTIPQFNISIPLIFKTKKFKSGLNKLTTILNDDKFFTMHDSELIKIEDIYPMFFKDCVFPTEIEFRIIIDNLIIYYEQYLTDTDNEQYLLNYYENNEILLDFFTVNLNLLQLLNRSEFTICNKNYLMLVCNSITGSEVVSKRADSQGLQGLDKKYYYMYLKYKNKYLKLKTLGNSFR